MKGRRRGRVKYQLRMRVSNDFSASLLAGGGAAEGINEFKSAMALATVVAALRRRRCPLLNL